MGLIYRLTADLIVIVHMAYVLFVIVGLLIILIGSFVKWGFVRNPWFRFIHLGMILVVVVESWLGIPCPLTVWEFQLRELAGETVQQGSFFAQWVHNALFIEAPASTFTLAYTLFGATVVGTFIWTPPKLATRRPDPIS